MLVKIECPIGLVDVGPVQRYEHGVPTTDLTPVPDDGTTGTTVHFHPDLAILVSPGVMAPELTRAARWPQLRVELVDERPN